MTATVNTEAALGSRFESDYWNPGPKYEAYLSRIAGLLGEEQRTVRDVYYALEARGFPDELRELDPDWEFEYRYVKRCVKKGRRAGFIDPGLIVDTSRQTSWWPSDGEIHYRKENRWLTYDDPEQYLSRVIEEAPSIYYEDPWEDQPTHVEVWLEKASLVSVFKPICREYNVRLEATRGDWSDSKTYEATQRLLNHVRDDDDVRVLYFGDFNPSGMHAPVAVQETMQHYDLEIPRGFGGSEYFDVWPHAGAVEAEFSDGSIMFERLALNLEHVERYDLPENPTPSSTDKDKQLRERFMHHVSDGRDVNIELNALKEYHRDDLEGMLREGIEQYIDDEQRDETANRVEERQTALERAINVDYDEVDGV